MEGKRRVVGEGLIAHPVLTTRTVRVILPPAARSAAEMEGVEGVKVEAQVVYDSPNWACEGGGGRKRAVGGVAKVSCAWEQWVGLKKVGVKKGEQARQGA